MESVTQACEPAGQWLTIWRELSATLGPAGAISVVFNAVQAYALWKLVMFFANKDDQKREDLRTLFAKVDSLFSEVREALASTVKVITNLRLAMAKRGIDVHED